MKMKADICYCTVSLLFLTLLNCTPLYISFCRCTYHPGAFGRGQTKALQCSQPKTGRFVFVRLRVTEYLTLCEVEVFAAKGTLYIVCCIIIFYFKYLQLEVNYSRF